MAIGIVSNDDFSKEIDNTTPRARSVDKREETKPIATPLAEIVDIPRPGRKEGDVNVPNSLRQVIGESSLTDGRQEAVELAERFGISPSQVSAYAKGATSTASYNERPNTSVITQSRVRVQKRAMGKLMSAMKNITDDKLSVTSARELAGVAKDMAAVIKTMEPEVESPDSKLRSNQPQFLVYAPQFRDERSYETIYAKE